MLNFVIRVETTHFWRFDANGSSLPKWNRCTNTVWVVTFWGCPEDSIRDLRPHRIQVSLFHIFLYMIYRLTQVGAGLMGDLFNLIIRWHFLGHLYFVNPCFGSPWLPFHHSNFGHLLRQKTAFERTLIESKRKLIIQQNQSIVLVVCIIRRKHHKLLIIGSQRWT